MLLLLLLLLSLALPPALALGAQTPAPFPRPAQPSGARPQPPPVQPPVAPPPSGQPPAGQPKNPAPSSSAPPSAAGQDAAAPTEITLGVPVYPSATYLESYDAGRGQRFFLFGSEADFLQVVAFYKTALKQRGDLIFEEPPMQMFELGKFREETMAFPPSVTVKDYGWGGSQGYLNPKRGGSPARFRTIIQVVPAPPAAPK